MFFGEPELDIADLLRTAPDGRGIVSASSGSPTCRTSRALFSTFLMWVLAELFETLPEVGDPDKPKLVFFFDEAHLLFDGCIEGVPRRGRPDRAADPLEGRRRVLHHPASQRRPRRGALPARHRVQHAVRAFTPKDARALKAAVETFPITEHYPDLAETLSSLGVGEAAVTVLDPRGVPTPVAATRLYPPASRMTPLTPEERAAILAASPLRPRYAERIDRESAAELLEARLSGDAAKAEEVRERAKPAPRREAPRDDEGLAGQVGDILGSSMGRQVTREVVRGIFGMLRKKR